MLKLIANFRSKAEEILKQNQMRHQAFKLSNELAKLGTNLDS